MLEKMEIDMQVSRNLKNLTRDLDGAKADNLKLVERMKYIQGYKVPNKSLSGIFMDGNLKNLKNHIQVCSFVQKALVPFDFSITHSLISNLQKSAELVQIHVQVWSLTIISWTS